MVSAPRPFPPSPAVLRPRRSIPRATFRALLALVVALVFAGFALTGATSTQRLLGAGLAALALWQAWREWTRGRTGGRSDGAGS